MRKRMSVVLAVGSMVLAGCSTAIPGTPTPVRAQADEVRIGVSDYVGTTTEMCTWLLDFLKMSEELEVDGFDRSQQLRDLYDWMIEGEDWSGLSNDERERTVQAFDLASSGRC